MTPSIAFNAAQPRHGLEIFETATFTTRAAAAHLAAGSGPGGQAASVTALMGKLLRQGRSALPLRGQSFGFARPKGARGLSRISDVLKGQI